MSVIIIGAHKYVHVCCARTQGCRCVTVQMHTEIRILELTKFHSLAILETGRVYIPWPSSSQSKPFSSLVSCWLLNSIMSYVDMQRILVSVKQLMQAIISPAYIALTNFSVSLICISVVSFHISSPLILPPLSFLFLLIFSHTLMNRAPQSWSATVWYGRIREPSWPTREQGSQQGIRLQYTLYW